MTFCVPLMEGTPASLGSLPWLLEGQTLKLRLGLGGKDEHCDQREMSGGGKGLGEHGCWDSQS